MGRLLKVAETSQIPPGTAKAVEVEGNDVQIEIPGLVQTAPLEAREARGRAFRGIDPAAATPGEAAKRR